MAFGGASAEHTIEILPTQVTAVADVADLATLNELSQNADRIDLNGQDVDGRTGRARGDRYRQL